MSELGDQITLAAFALKGLLTQETCDQISLDIMNEVGLSPVHKKIVYSYPTEGKGGNGFTMIQPVAESFFAWDVWFDHKGGYLILCSCVPFNAGVITGILSRYGLKVLNMIATLLTLVEDK
jgi:hypothetical protein